MADVKWIKIATDIFDDEKILLIESMPDAYEIITCWFKLLCLAGKQNNDGVFTLNDKIAYTDDMLATIFRMKKSTVKLAIDTFETFGMVETVNGVITIPKWSKHQNTDGLDKIREQTRKRVSNYRERKALECNVTGNATVTQCNAIDKNRKDTDIEKDKKNKRFTPPSVDEVTSYCVERGNNIDGQSFVDFYESKGWKVGNQQMKDWKAAVRTWERRKQDEPKPKTTAFNEFKQRNYDFDSLEQRLLSM